APPPPPAAPPPPALPPPGDDSGAKASATRLLDLLGFDTVDGGTLADSWRFQPGTPAYGIPYAQDPEGLAIADDPGRSADAATVRTALAAATRG
ncbi:NADP oxidoreductase, partial [Streptomyces sp. NPDC059569]